MWSDEQKENVLGRRTLRHSKSTGHASEWPPTDVSSDLTVDVGTRSFALHKFPLASRSGKIRKLMSESKDYKLSRINLQTVPGGAQAFELAAKYCYGVNIEITLSNVAMLQCVAHYLQMTEEFGEKNLEFQTELFLKEMVFPSITNSLFVLHHCEVLLPTAEDINLIDKLITIVVSSVCKEQLTIGISKLETLSDKQLTVEPESLTNLWGNTTTILSIDFFQRILTRMKSKGLKQDIISKILINYAHNYLHNLPIGSNHRTNGSPLDAGIVKQQRLILETIVGLLPTHSRKSHIPLLFLSRLLKTAAVLSASSLCKTDLENRIGLQLDQAILEDILIPTSSYNNTNQPLYDTDSVLRIFCVFLDLEECNERSHLKEEIDPASEFDIPGSPKQNSILKVSRLMDSYLTEIALDSNLMASKFFVLAELLPDHARVVSDGIYRAVDIFLKVHPNIKQSDRCRLCKTINCQKLSREACSHAAQNERLPVQMAIQVIYFEQIRLRNAMNGNHDQFFIGSTNGQFGQRSTSGVGSGAMSPRDNYASIRRENRELKLEVARMRMRLTDLEKDHVSMKKDLIRSNPAKSLLGYFTKKIRKINTIFRFRETTPSITKSGSEARLLFQKKRCHSIS